MKKTIIVVILCLCTSRGLSEETIPKFLLGPPGIDNGRLLRELVEQPEAWEKLREKTDGIHYACQNITRHFPTDDEQKELFTRLQEIKMPLHLEVGAVKPWGPTAEQTFRAQKPQIDRYLRLGADIRGIAMDEPLNCCRNDLAKDMEYAAEQTADFVARVRAEYPDFIIGDIEGFPSLTADEVIQWIDLVQAKIAERGVRKLDFFRIDTDWMHFVQNTGRGSWKDMKRVENHCRKIGLPFSVIYWSAGLPATERRGLTGDDTWFVGTMHMAYAYAAVDGKPDQIIVQSWVNAPARAVPETDPFTLTGTAKHVVEKLIKDN